MSWPTQRWWKLRPHGSSHRKRISLSPCESAPPHFEHSVSSSSLAAVESGAGAFCGRREGDKFWIVFLRDGAEEGELSFESFGALRAASRSARSFPRRTGVCFGELLQWRDSHEILLSCAQVRNSQSQAQHRRLIQFADSMSRTLSENSYMQQRKHPLKKPDIRPEIIIKNRK